MRKIILARREKNGEWDLIEDRVDIDSEYFLDPTVHDKALVFAQEPSHDEEGTAFKAVEDPVPGLQWFDAPGYLDPRTLDLSKGRAMKTSEAKHFARGIDYINRQADAMRAMDKASSIAS